MNVLVNGNEQKQNEQNEQCVSKLPFFHGNHLTVTYDNFVWDMSFRGLGLQSEKNNGIIKQNDD